MARTSTSELPNLKNKCLSQQDPFDLINMIHPMKKHLLALCFGLLAFPVMGNAGNMFGPAAFRNGSPLVSGVDGTYQATARAANVTGIFRFAYSGGSQTANTRQNSWIFFVNGQILKGNVEANIDDSTLNGILDGDSTSSSRTTNQQGQTTLPVYFFSGANSASGNFQGKLNQKSPSGAFSGSGELLPTPGAINEFTAIYQTFDVQQVGTNSVILVPDGYAATNLSYTNAGGTIAPLSFKFRGVRTSTSASSSVSTNSSGN